MYVCTSVSDVGSYSLEYSQHSMCARYMCARHMCARHMCAHHMCGCHMCARHMCAHHMCARHMCACHMCARHMCARHMCARHIHQEAHTCTHLLPLQYVNQLQLLFERSHEFSFLFLQPLVISNSLLHPPPLLLTEIL